MNITSAKFVKGIVGPDDALAGIPHVAFVGRSNVGKSSLINSLTNQKNLARISSLPGATRQINVFLVSASGVSKPFYFVDLPGYGFAKASRQMQDQLQRLIYWYLFDSEYEQKKVVLIIDAKVGATDNDAAMLHSLKEQDKDIILVANKIDKLKASQSQRRLNEFKQFAGSIPVIPFSSEKKIGTSELLREIYS